MKRKHNPTLALLRTIECVDRVQSYIRASKELGVATPTVSATISTFERVMRRKLLIRLPGPQGIRMTEEGARLADAIRPLIPLIADAFENFKEDAPELDASEFEPAIKHVRRVRQRTRNP